MARAFLGCLALLASTAWAADEPAVSFTSPGFPATTMDAQGRLMEDWAPVGVKLAGDGVTEGPVQVRAVVLDGAIPGAEAVSGRGSIRLGWTAFRAPAFPTGVDVLTVRLEETAGKPAEVTVGLDVPDTVVFGRQTLRMGNRPVVALPETATPQRESRPWGYADDATPLPGWGKPAAPCDPAFRNIRAGLGGVPIVYRFRVEPDSRASVVLGFCESHWAERGQRPMVCHVEGAPAQSVEPVAKWGQHKPGALLFAAHDANRDGSLEIAVVPARGAPDRNPILNVLWIFAAGETPNLDQVIAGNLNAAALHYVDVGGENDQSLYPPGKLEYRLSLAAGEVKELTFLVACAGGSAPVPGTSAWTPDLLRRAACEVWRAWK